MKKKTDIVVTIEYLMWLLRYSSDGGLYCVLRAAVVNLFEKKGNSRKAVERDIYLLDEMMCETGLGLLEIGDSGCSRGLKNSNWKVEETAYAGTSEWGGHSSSMHAFH